MIVFVAFEDEKFYLFMLCNWFIIDVMPLKSSISLFFLHRSIFIMNNLCFLFIKLSFFSSLKSLFIILWFLLCFC